jgi:folate-dependent phosphoribosylglycinamide formyltransferase PurN
MDDKIEHGSIIDQMDVVIRDYDTSENVYERIVEYEKQLIQKKLKSIING